MTIFINGVLFETPIVYSTPITGNIAIANVYFDQSTGDVIPTDELSIGQPSIPLVSNPGIGMDRIYDLSWDPVAQELVKSTTIPAALVSNPPTGKKKVTNVWDDAGVLKAGVEP